MAQHGQRGKGGEICLNHQLRSPQAGHPGIAYRAVAVESGFAILHPHPSGVFHLPLGFALEAVGFHPHLPMGSCLTRGISKPKGATLVSRPLSTFPLALR
jgi:hypothetical protein